MREKTDHHFDPKFPSSYLHHQTPCRSHRGRPVSSASLCPQPISWVWNPHQILVRHLCLWVCNGYPSQSNYLMGRKGRKVDTDFWPALHVQETGNLVSGGVQAVHLLPKNHALH